MDINKDFVPSTIQEAVGHIVSVINEEESELIKNDKDIADKCHHTLGQYLRNNWSLWEPDTPLKRDAIERYKIAHADDISSLILDWVVAIIRDDGFCPYEECKVFHEHWKKYGMTSLEAGG